MRSASDPLSALALREAWHEALKRHRDGVLSGALPREAEERARVSRETEALNAPGLSPVPHGELALACVPAEAASDLDEGALFSRLERYAHAVREANRRIALVTRRDPEAQIRANVLDSMFLGLLLRASGAGSPEIPAPACAPPGGFLLDAGSGSGAPGIPAWLMLEGSSGTVAQPRLILLEATGKKAEFLLELVEALELDAATVIRDRLESPALAAALDELDTAPHGILAARALAPTDRILQWCKGLGGRIERIYAYKGMPTLWSEWRHESARWDERGWGAKAAHLYLLPDRLGAILELVPAISLCR